MIDTQTSLFGEGSNQNDLESKMGGSSNLPTEKELQREIWVRNARIALPRFPELQKGENVSDREVRRRLRDLKENKFPVGNYSRISPQKRWNLLMSYRSIIWREARRYCPDVAEEIDRQNREIKERAYLLR